ncbi:hypothetical protein [Vibrio sp. HN007]|uniref:hypothetical protein n=1 Tax=Vibrio iocasae TaxID=3098914 RepID=UPI0035D41C47
MKKKYLLLLVSILTLAGCDDDLPPDPGPPGTETLEGIDSDGDGVRDDVQRYIHQNYLGKDDRDALKSLAISYQKAIILHENEEESLNQWSYTSRSIHCLFEVDVETAHIKIRELRSEVLNTRARVEAYFRSQKHLSGRTFSVADIEDSKAICNGELPASKVRELP